MLNQSEIEVGGIVHGTPIIVVNGVPFNDLARAEEFAVSAMGPDSARGPCDGAGESMKAKYPKRYRKRRSTRVWVYSPWNFQIEPGDLIVDSLGQLCRAVESRGPNQSRQGLLTTRDIPAPDRGVVAKIRRGEVWWVLKKEGES